MGNHINSKMADLSNLVALQQDALDNALDALPDGINTDDILDGASDALGDALDGASDLLDDALGSDILDGALDGASNILDSALDNAGQLSDIAQDAIDDATGNGSGFLTGNMFLLVFLLLIATLLK